MNKKTWGNSVMKYCPKSKQVWQKKYNSNTCEYEIITYNSMPSFGLEKEDIPDGKRISG
tara:strand:+ start:9169 stop:9345 length:177 start_codon:yes stop_codon:yes gene_type:complete